MMGKDDWMEEDQAIGEEFTAGEIDREDADRRLKDLGFDPLEIKDTLDELELNLDSLDREEANADAKRDLDREEYNRG